jgi:DNA-binding NarL/FixJ family response regulator
VGVSGDPVSAVGRAPDPAVWLIGLPPVVARSARAALAAERLAPRGGTLDATAPGAVAVVGSPGLGPAEQRREVLAAVERLAPAGIVAVTEIERRSALQRLMATGGDGLVLLAELDVALAIAVRAVAAGQVCVPAAVRAAVAPRPLSPRERQILAMVIMGQSNGVIAQRLHITESTVKSHMASIFEKLGVRSRAEAAQLVTDPEEMLGTGIVTLSGGSQGA